MGLLPPVAPLVFMSLTVLSEAATNSSAVNIPADAELDSGVMIIRAVLAAILVIFLLVTPPPLVHLSLGQRQE